MSNHHLFHRPIPILYAQNCPDQPLILEEEPEEVVIKKEKHSYPPKPVSSRISYEPHIIKSKRFVNTSTSWYQLAEHDRQLLSLNTRIQNCKSLTQRKKDHNDPIVYPAYFFRERKMSKDARIDGYFRQILAGKEKKTIHRTASKRRIMIKEERQAEHIKQNMRKTKSYIDTGLKKNIILPNPEQFSSIPLPSIRFKANPPIPEDERVIPNLPKCTIPQILFYILTRKIYYQSDLKILHARLIHYYGQFRVNNIWLDLMRQLSTKLNNNR